MAAKRTKGTKESKTKSSGRGAKKAKQVVSLSIDLDELERLYRQIHGMIEEGDTKSHELRLSDGDSKGVLKVRRIIRADGDTKGGARRRSRRRRSDGDTKGGEERRRRRSDGDTKGGNEPRPRRRRSDGDTKGGNEPARRRPR
jgi:hypothetical protein